MKGGWYAKTYAKICVSAIFYSEIFGELNDLPKFIELLTNSEVMLVLGHVDETGWATVVATAWTSKLDYKTAGFFSQNQ